MAAAPAVGVIPEPGPFSKFAEFVADTKSKNIGHDIAGNPKKYVPYSALVTYWTTGSISRVLRAFPGSGRLDIDIDLIKRRYLRIFSTLVYTSPAAVNNFQNLFISKNLDDKRLPWRSRPSEWPDEKFFRDFFKQIAPHQWQFFPFDFSRDNLHDLRIDDECILPIDPTTPIAQGSAATIERFEVHPESNNLAHRVRPPSPPLFRPKPPPPKLGPIFHFTDANLRLIGHPRQADSTQLCLQDLP